MGSILESHSSCHSVTPTAVLMSARVISSDVVSLMVQELDLGLRQPAGGLTEKRHSSTLSWHHWEFWLRDSTYKNEHYARIYIPEAHWAMWQPILNKIGKFDIQWKTAFHSYGGNWKNCFHPHGMKLITNCLNAPHPRSCKVVVSLDIITLLWEWNSLLHFLAPGRTENKKMDWTPEPHLRVCTGITIFDA